MLPLLSLWNPKPKQTLLSVNCLLHSVLITATEKSLIRHAWLNTLPTNIPEAVSTCRGICQQAMDAHLSTFPLPPASAARAGYIESRVLKQRSVNSSLILLSLLIQSRSGHGDIYVQGGSPCLSQSNLSQTGPENCLQGDCRSRKLNNQY